MDTTYNKARDFIYRNARPLDLARWQYHFENGSKDNVLKALAAFQNDDGGFGHALEPDTWNACSSPSVSAQAVNILLEVDALAPPIHVVERLLKYFETCPFTASNGWPFRIATNNEYPHAPWWTYTDADANPASWNYNPTAIIVGFILRVAEPGMIVYDKAYGIMEQMIKKLHVANDMEVHEVGCYVSLYNLLKESQLFDRIDLIKEKLHCLVNQSIEKDTKNWSAYTMRPSMYIESNSSDFQSGNEDIIRCETEYLLRTQNADGSWDITWRWNSYEEEFPIAAMWWKGHWIVQNIRYLKSFSRC